MKKIRLVIMVISAGLAGVARADLLVKYDFASGAADKLAPTTTGTNVTASGLTIDSPISLSTGTEPSYIGSGALGRILLSDNDLDVSVDDATHHGMHFTLTPGTVGDGVTITNVALQIYSAANLISKEWIVAVFVDAGAGEAKAGEYRFASLAISSLFAFDLNLPVTGAQNQSVAVRLDFADTETTAPSYNLYLDRIDVYGNTSVVPEPTTLGLVVVSSVGLFFARRMHR
jgi:hypothetical protein